MGNSNSLTAAQIRQSILDNPTKRARDLADFLNIGEAALVAAQVSVGGATKITADPNVLIPRLKELGPVMALTRTASVVHEKDGIYDNYHAGDHASMVLNGAIDLRIFPSHWVHAFAVRVEKDESVRHSIQIFDAAGDAVHKIHARQGTDIAALEQLTADLATDDQSDTLTLATRQPPEEPKSNTAKLDILRHEWDRMTDTHQFLRLTSKLGMNRLGAYRIVGDPYVQQLHPDAVNTALERLAETALPSMIFVGNRGCIQIHSGPIHNLRKMGPWQNVMDPEFNLHLRLDHIAEVYAVHKPTRRGMAHSIEAFDKDGAIILQIFGMRSDAGDFTENFAAICAALPTLEKETV